MRRVSLRRARAAAGKGAAAGLCAEPCRRDFGSRFSCAWGRVWRGLYLFLSGLRPLPGAALSLVPIGRGARCSKIAGSGQQAVAPALTGTQSPPLSQRAPASRLSLFV